MLSCLAQPYLWFLCTCYYYCLVFILVDGALRADTAGHSLQGRLIQRQGSVYPYSLRYLRPMGPHC
ncbi:hypothetical protein CCUS01_08023 [Colletotrichum cuscutae]|uniref:Uncharacterized protein n=1 Tax=Colletotrichum cuscutae TaxID=1209917 RepID=A0AAI9XUM4_9PEZI|nr:hypothetical protein CCUS01_08023 [Colletotrichum cuscutae]